MNRKRFFALITSFALMATLAAPISAMTSTEMQEMIEALNAQIALLQQQLANLSGGSTTTPSFTGIPASFTFARNLRLGSSGDDVKYLQIILNSDPDTRLRESGVGAPGQETSYFGPLTESAVIKFQNKYATTVLHPLSLTSGTGFVGSSTRTKLNAILVEANEPEVVLPPVDDDDDEPSVPVTGLSVKLAATNPAPGYIISGTAGGNTSQHAALMGAYALTAGGEDIAVTSLNFERKGFVTDGDISNLYLFVDGAMVSDFATNIATRHFNFSGSPLFTVGSGKTAEVELRMDIASAVAAGSTIGFDLTTLTSNASAVTGTFPLSGSLMSVANTSALATVGVNIDNGTNPTNKKVGATDQILAAFTFETTSDVVVEEMIFTVIGSLASSDLRNFRLIDENENTVATVSALNGSKQIVFSDINLALDQNTDFQIRGDIAGGANRTVQIMVHQAHDVVVRDTEFEVAVLTDVSNASQTSWTITAGDFTVVRRADSPVGSVELDAKNVVLAKYDLTAGGERVKVTSLKVKATVTGGRDLNNLKVLVDGSQRGSTVPSLAGDGAATADFTFGNTFVIPLGDTKTLSIVGDLDDLQANDTILITGANNELIYDLLDSVTLGKTMTLPSARTLKAVAGSLTIESSSLMPDAQVLTMGSTTEVGRWKLTPVNSNTRLRTLEFDATNLDQSRNIDSATLKLYENGSVVQSKSTNIYADNKIWFGNSTDKDGYPATTVLNWELDYTKSYDLALELTVGAYVPGVATESPNSGDAINVTLESIAHRLVGKSTDTDEAGLTLPSNSHEIYHTTMTVTAEGSEGNRTIYGGTARTVMAFDIKAGNSADVIVNAIKFSLGGTIDAAGTGDFTVRKSGDSNDVFRLKNKAVADGAAYSSQAGNNVTLDKTTHALEVGDVIKLTASGNPNAVVVAVNGATVTLLTLAGGNIPDDVAAVAQGDATFLTESTLYVPSRDLVRSTIGTGETFSAVVRGDTSGIGAGKSLSLSIANGSDITWSSEYLGTAVDDNETTDLINTFPAESKLNLVPSS